MVRHHRNPNSNGRYHPIWQSTWGGAMYNLLPCIQFEFFKYFNFLTDYRVHILVVSFYAMANIHHRAGLRSVFCIYGTCFHFFGDTLFIRQMHAGNNAADKCGRQIQQIQVINPTNLAAGGNLAPIGAGSWQWHGAISASFTSSQSPSDWQLDNPLRLTTGQVQPVCWS